MKGRLAPRSLSECFRRYSFCLQDVGDASNGTQHNLGAYRQVCHSLTRGSSAVLHTHAPAHPRGALTGAESVPLATAVGSIISTGILGTDAGRLHTAPVAAQAVAAVGVLASGVLNGADKVRPVHGELEQGVLGATQRAVRVGAVHAGGRAALARAEPDADVRARGHGPVPGNGAAPLAPAVHGLAGGEVNVARVVQEFGGQAGHRAALLNCHLGGAVHRQANLDAVRGELDAGVRTAGVPAHEAQHVGRALGHGHAARTSHGCT